MSLFQFGFTRSINSTDTTVPSHMPDQIESGLGAAEYSMVVDKVSTLADPNPRVPVKRTRGKYKEYTDEDRAKIGKYASENGNERAIRHFRDKIPGLSESTVRNFKKKYCEKLREEKRKECPQPVVHIPLRPRGRPPLMGDLDGSLLKFLRAVRAKGGVINIHVVKATAEALIKSQPNIMTTPPSFEMNTSWVQSVYRRLGYKRRMGTTSRPPVPRGIYEECRRDFLGDILHCIKEHSIPPALVLNADQTPSSYVSVGKQTMASCGAKSVAIKGITDKRNITLTFVVTLDGLFLPMQIIYSGKTRASLPRSIQFPEGFSLAYNEKHWSNEATTIKLIDEIVHPYLVKKRKELKLAPTHKALMIWDVFRGQMTTPVKRKLESLSIMLIPVPANMTHFFQPLDLTVNGAAKKYTKREFVTYYSSSVQQQLTSGKNIEDIEVDLKLSTIKPLHAQWLVNLYSFFTTSDGREITLKGWKRAGVTGVLDGTITLEEEDPFHNVYA